MKKNLDKWETIVLDPSAKFSASEARSEIKTLLKEYSTPSKERNRAMFLAYIVELKTQNLDLAIDYGVECHKLQLKFNALVALEHFNLCYQVGNAAASIQDFDTAAEFLGLAYEKRTARPNLSDDQILGIQEKWAHALHEVNDFKKALEVNLRVLTGGEKLFGEHSENLYAVINNIAQNYYMLKDMEKAEQFLQKALVLTQNIGDQAKEYDTVFQLGVLCSENDRHDEAIDHFKYQIEIAEDMEDEDLIDQAKSNLIRAKKAA